MLSIISPGPSANPAGPLSSNVRQQDGPSALPELLPHAIAWANFQSQYVQHVGVPERRAKVHRSPRGRSRTRTNSNPSGRCTAVAREEPRLARSSTSNWAPLSPSVVGLTLGHSILVVHGHADKRLLHEFRHVFQYEDSGSIEGFLPVCLQQVVAHAVTRPRLFKARRASPRSCCLTLRSSGTATGKALLGPQGARCHHPPSWAKPLTGVSPSAQTLAVSKEPGQRSSSGLRSSRATRGAPAQSLRRLCPLLGRPSARHPAVSVHVTRVGEFRCPGSILGPCVVVVLFSSKAV